MTQSVQVNRPEPPWAIAIGGVVRGGELTRPVPLPGAVVEVVATGRRVASSTAIIASRAIIKHAIATAAAVQRLSYLDPCSVKMTPR